MTPKTILLAMVAGALMILVILAWLAASVEAQTIVRCYEYKSLIDTAKSTQGEIPIGTGLGPAGTLTVLIDPKDMSWGIITRANNGCSLYFGGEDFQFADPPPKPGKDS